MDNKCTSVFIYLTHELRSSRKHYVLLTFSSASVQINKMCFLSQNKKFLLSSADTGVYGIDAAK